MNKYKKLVSNSIIFAIGNLGSKFVQFILVPLYTYTLTKSEFGKVDVITNIVNLVGVLITLDISDAIFRFALDKNENKEKVFTTGIFVAVFALLLGLTIIPFFNLFKPQYPIFLGYCFLCSYMLFSCVSNYIRAIGYTKSFAIAGIISTLTTATSNIILLVIFKQGMNGYIISLILANLSAIIFLFSVTGVLKHINLEKFDFSLLKKMLVYSIPLIPNSIAWWLNSSSDRFFIVLFMGASANGLYAVASKIPSLLTIFTTVFMQSWQISTVEEYRNADSKDFFSKIFEKFSSLLFSVSIVILLFLKPLLKIVISPLYYESWKFVPLLLLSVIYSGLASFLGTMYTATKKTVPVMVTTILGAIVNVIFTVILIPTWGLNGAAFANIISFLVVCFIRLKDMYKGNILKVNAIKILLDHLLFFVTSLFIYFSFSNMMKIIITFVIIFLLLFINHKTLKAGWSILQKKIKR